jgi:hypothetical protein
MAKLKPKLKPKRKRKRRSPTAKTEIAVEKVKEIFLRLLGDGLSPGAACRKIPIARSAVYRWANDDTTFAADWKDAVETGLDLLETRLFKSGLAGNDMTAMFTLKHRRYDKQKDNKVPSNYILNITLAEHEKRLQRLGLPVPMIESDLEEDDVTDITVSGPSYP